MKSSKPEVDVFIEALRSDLPSASDEARVRARLYAAGVLATSAAVTTSASGAAGSGAAASGTSGTLLSASGAAPHAALSGTAASGAAASGAVASAGMTTVGAGAGASTVAGSLGAGAAPAAIVKAGLLSKVLLLPAAAKLGVAATLAVAAATGVPLVLERTQPEAIVAPRSAVKTPASVGPVASVRAPAEPTQQADALLQPASRGANVAAAEDSRQGSAAAETPRPQPPAEAALRSGKAAHQPAGARTRESQNEAQSNAHERARSPVVVAERGRTEAVRASTLGEEARLIEQAMLALGAGDTALARRLLEDHTRRFPDGALARERERALERVRQAAAP
jgi:hypothetical protein